VRVPKVYLETIVFNFPFVDDAPDKRRDAIKLFEEIADVKNRLAENTEGWQ
jgi:hypothetical protein